MKKILIICLAIIATTFTACQDNAAKKVTNATITPTPGSTASLNASGPIITFDKIEHDFGTINEGEKVTTEFNFTNTGKEDLIIVDAPGATGEIRVSFDSSNKPGLQQKSVTLSANTASGREMLRIKSNVTPDPVKQQQRDAQAKARQ